MSSAKGLPLWFDCTGFAGGSRNGLLDTLELSGLGRPEGDAARRNGLFEEKLMGADAGEGARPGEMDAQDVSEHDLPCFTLTTCCWITAR